MCLRQPFISICIFLIALLVGSTSQAESRRTNSVILAVEDSWPPYADANGEGISTNILSQAFASVGISLTVKVAPYARVLSDVEKGVLVGGYNVTRQSSTEKQFLFGQQALLKASASFYFPAGHLQAKEYISIDDIPDGTTIGLIIDYEYGELFEKHKHRFKQVRVSQQDQIINMLQLDRIDSAILFDAVASHTLKSMQLKPSSILKGPINHTSDIYVAFSRSHKQAQYFADKLDQGLIQLKKDGRYEKLLQFRPI
jgi:polar amino acid transport system substrate-binding protein